MSIQPLTPDLAKSFGLPNTTGALISSEADASPAAAADLRPGDVIVRYDGKPVDAPRALPALVASTEIGRTVELEVVRDGSARAVRVTVGNLADSRERRIRPEWRPARPAAHTAAEYPGRAPASPWHRMGGWSILVGR